MPPGLLNSCHYGRNDFAFPGLGVQPSLAYYDGVGGLQMLIKVSRIQDGVRSGDQLGGEVSPKTAGEAPGGAGARHATWVTGVGGRKAAQAFLQQRDGGGVGALLGSEYAGRI